MSQTGDGSPGAIEGLALRQACVSALELCLHDQQPLDAAIESALVASFSNSDEAQRSRGFVRQAVATTLRRLGQIDDVLGRFIKRPIPAKARRVTSVLRIGTAQLLFLDVADHATIHVAVEQIKANSRTRHMAGLANAVLRKVSGEGRKILDTQDPPTLNTPQPLLAVWQADYGEECARDIATAHLDSAPLDLSAKVNPTDVAQLTGGALLGTGTVRLPGSGRVNDVPGFAEGKWWVQDASAALPAKLFGPIEGKRICDLCAAPGGKTAQLVAAGAHVVAVDQSKRRLNRLQDNLERLNLSAERVVADVLTWTPETAFDHVLLDAPCSSTGTIRRHPELVWRLSLEDIAYQKLLGLQQSLLQRASEFVRPAGSLVYCTCSLQKAEGETQIVRFLANNPDWETLPIGDGQSAPGLEREWVTAEGWMRLLPQFSPTVAADSGNDGAARGMDGFFAAQLRRRS